jgi:hypothetical protein
MSREAAFSDSRCNEQTTDNLHARAGATHKTAFREFEIGYELAHGELEALIANAISALEFPSTVQTVTRSKIEDLHADVRDAIEAGFKDHSWKMNRMWRALKWALRETAES